MWRWLFGPSDEVASAEARAETLVAAADRAVVEARDMASRAAATAEERVAKAEERAAKAERLAAGAMAQAKKDVVWEFDCRLRAERERLHEEVAAAARRATHTRLYAAAVWRGEAHALQSCRVASGGGALPEQLALFAGLAAMRGHVAVLEQIRTLAADGWYDGDVLCFALACGRTEVLDWVAAGGAPPRDYRPSAQRELMAARASGYGSSVQHDLESARASIDVARRLRTALYEAGIDAAEVPEIEWIETYAGTAFGRRFCFATMEASWLGCGEWITAPDKWLAPAWSARGGPRNLSGESDSGDEDGAGAAGAAGAAGGAGGAARPNDVPAAAKAAAVLWDFHYGGGARAQRLWEAGADPGEVLVQAARYGQLPAARSALAQVPPLADIERARAEAAHARWPPMARLLG